MDELSVIIREWEPGDIPFIYSTWRNSTYYGASKKPADSVDFFMNKNKEIDAILEREPLVRVAVMYGDPTLILGYSVGEGSKLYFVYVKEAYRNSGIGTLLCGGYTQAELPETKIGKAIYEAKFHS